MATQEKYNEPFPSRLRKLLDDRGVTITALSKELKISRQAVSQYTDGSAQPNIEKLRAIASFFDVSADYLVGLSGYEKKSTAELTAADMGIMDEAAQQLAEDKIHYAGISGGVLSMLAMSPQFSDFASAVSDYIGAVNRAKEWSRTVSSIYEERKNVRVKRFLLTESLFDVLDDYVKIPDFSALELKARMLEKKRKEVRKNAISKEENK